MDGQISVGELEALVLDNLLDGEQIINMSADNIELAMEDQKTGLVSGLVEHQIRRNSNGYPSVCAVQIQPPRCRLNPLSHLLQ